MNPYMHTEAEAMAVLRACAAGDGRLRSITTLDYIHPATIWRVLEWLHAEGSIQLWYPGLDRYTITEHGRAVLQEAP